MSSTADPNKISAPRSNPLIALKDLLQRNCFVSRQCCQERGIKVWTERRGREASLKKKLSEKEKVMLMQVENARRI